MNRSMLSAVSALRNHQLYMDVVANNIANINTIGFKASRVNFQEVMSQTLRAGSGPQGDRGGMNAMQVGLGMTVGGIDAMFTQGGLSATAKSTDLAIQGDGFFVLEENGLRSYSRDGAMDVSLNGYLIHSATAQKVMGWMVDPATGIASTDSPAGPLMLSSPRASAQPSSLASYRGNLDAGAALNAVITTNIGVYDSLGNLHNMTIGFEKTGQNEWEWSMSDEGGNVVGGPTAVAFLADGRFDPANAAAVVSVALTNGAASPQTVTLDLTNVTQLASQSEVIMYSQDGLAPGSLVGFNVGPTGEVIGVFSNGMNRTVAQMAMARFVNPGGLQRMGQNLFAETPNSGAGEVGAPGSNNRGQIVAGYLEMSNVDLAQQFTNMIVAQRGLQANSRVITTSDEMLQEMVSLKR
jgi:flagellar hook protein FlgE